MSGGRNIHKRGNNIKNLAVDSKSNTSRTLMWSNPKGTGDEFVVRRPSSARSVSSTKSISSVKGSKKSSINQQITKGKHSKNSKNSMSDNDINNLSTSIEKFLTKDDQYSGFPEININTLGEATLSESGSDSNDSTDFIEEDYIQNHHCPNCKKVMISANIPLIVYPCGHTFCSVCLEKAKYCLSCKMTITSVQQNVALESVITNYIDEKKKKKEQEKRIKIDKYLNEIANVDARYDVLQAEASSVIDNMETITENIVDKENEIESFNQKSVFIKKEIEKLQMNLSSCEKSHSSAVLQHQNLEEQYEKNKDQLLMIEKTMKSLQKNKESIKEMIEDLHPGYFSEFEDEA